MVTVKVITEVTQQHNGHMDTDFDAYIKEIDVSHRNITSTTNDNEIDVCARTVTYVLQADLHFDLLNAIQTESVLQQIRVLSIVIDYDTW